MTCEVYGNVGHSGNDCPKTREDVAFINNGFRQPCNNGWNNQSCPQGNLNYNSNYNSNQPSFKELVLGQAKINKNITKKLMSNDKMLKNINSQIEGLTSTVKNQLSFNKMVETQLAQIATTIPVDCNGKIPAQPKNSHENVKAVTTRGGKTTRDPPIPNQSTGKEKECQEDEPSIKEKEKEQEELMAPKDFIDTSYLPFPTRNCKQAMDEQFARFVEMIEKIHVSVPLMDVLHVPSYTKYIKDIINNK
jgi:hypothetical protein